MNPPWHPESVTQLRARIPDAFLVPLTLAAMLKSGTLQRGMPRANVFDFSDGVRLTMNRTVADHQYLSLTVAWGFEGWRRRICGTTERMAFGATRAQWFLGLTRFEPLHQMLTPKGFPTFILPDLCIASVLAIHKTGLYDPWEAVSP